MFGEVDLIFTWAKKNSLNADKEETDRDAREGEGVGKDHSLPVHHHQPDQEEAEDGEAKVLRSILKEDAPASWAVVVDEAEPVALVNLPAEFARKQQTDG